MESLLTPLVGRLLSKFVKSAAGSDGADLRASLQGGNVTLHNLELNLDTLLHKLPVAVERAFAMQLTVSIPWTSLTSQPIQITLDTVEVVLSGSVKAEGAGEQTWGDSMDASAVAKEAKGSDEPFLGGGWMGSLANMLMRTLLNVTINVKNIVVKYKTPATLATLTCKYLHVKTADDLRLENLEDSRSWLRKDAEFSSLVISLESLAARGSAWSPQQPLFVSAGALISAQFPVFAVLEKQDQGVYNGSVDVKIESTAVALNESRLSTLAAFIAALPRVAGHSEGSQAEQGQELAETQTRSLPSTFSPRKAVGRREMQRRRRAAEAIFRGDGGSATSGVSSAAAGAMGTVGSVWSFIVNDAAAESAQTAHEGPPVPKISKSNIRVALTCSLTGGTVLLLHDSVVEGGTAGGQTLSPPLTPRTSTAIWDKAGPGNPLPGASLKGKAIPAASPSFLEELEEAAASLPLSPAASLPEQVGAQAAADFTSKIRTQLASRIPSTAAFLSAEFTFLQVGLAVANEQLTSLDVQLRSCSVLRTLEEPEQSVVQDVVLGLYPVEGVESSALIDSDGQSLALRIRWQPDRDPAAPVPHLASVHVGHFFAAYVPGLAMNLLDFFRGLLPPQMGDPASSRNAPGDQEMAGSVNGHSDAADSGDSQQNPAQRLAPPAWLTGGAVIGCSVMSLQLVALSAPSLRAEAAALCVQRVSVHLGPFRPTARPGSLTAELFGLQRRPLPGSALRVAVVGARLGVAERWLHAASRSGGEDALAAAGVRCISDAIEVQAIVHEAEFAASISPDASASAGTAQPREGQPVGAHSGQALQPDTGQTSPAGGETWVAAMAVSPLLLRMGGGEVAALQAVAEGAVAETSREFRGPIPQRCPPTDEAGSAGSSATLTLQTSRMQMLYATAGAGHFMATEEANTNAHHALRLSCPSVSAALCLDAAAAQYDQHGDGASVGKGVSCTAVRLVLMAGPGLSVTVPACEVSVGKFPGGGDISQEASQHTSGLSACGPPILLVHDIRLEGPSQPEGGGEAGPLGLSVQSISFSLALRQLTLLVSWMVSLVRAPLLPVLPQYPAAELASGHGGRSMQASIAIISGQLATVDALPPETNQLSACTRGFAVGLHNFALQLETTSSQASAHVTDKSRSLMQLMQMQLGLIDICTLCPVSDQDVQLISTLRCQGPSSSQPGVVVTSRVKAGSGAVDEQTQDVSINVHTVETRVTPAVTSEAQALLLAVLCAVPARPASSKDERALERSSTAAQPERMTRLAVRSITLEAASDCMASHEQSSMSASDLPKGATSAVGRAEDVVLLMHDAGRQRMREWPLPTALSTHVEVSMVSAALTLFGPGLPYRGAPLLLPAAIHMSATCRNDSLCLNIDGEFLLLQSSVPVLLALKSLAECFSKPQMALSMQPIPGQIDDGHDTPGFVADDLRCGLFEPIDNLGARPGPLQISCGDQAATSGVWSQAARSFVSWRLPYPRQVHRVLIAAPHEGLAGVSVQLSGIDQGSGGSVTVPLVLDTWQGSLSADAPPGSHWLLTAQGDVPAAEEWELSWEGRPTKGSWCGAASMLRSLYINPAGAGLPDVPHSPPLCLVPFTLILCAKHLRLGVCLNDSSSTYGTSSLLQEDSVLVDVRDLQVGVSRWPLAQAVQLSGSVQVSYLDESTLTQELLLEPFSMSASAEVSGEPEPGTASVAGVAGSMSPQDSMLHARPLPQSAGISIRICVEDGPLIVRLSELGMQQLRRLMASAAGSIEKLQAHSQPDMPPLPHNGELSSADAPHREGTRDGTAQQATGLTSRAGSSGKACMHLENSSPIDLFIGQVGTHERVFLPSGASKGYTWHSAPGLDQNARRQLRVSSAASSAAPAVLTGEQVRHTGTSCSKMQQAGHSSVDGCDVPLQWSEAFEGLAESATVVCIPVQAGVRALLSVLTTQVDGTWHIVLRPSHALVNRTATALQLQVISSPLQCSPINNTIELGPPQDEHSSVIQPLMVSYAISGSSAVPSSDQTALRIWLGRGYGWSLEIPLGHITPQVIRLQAGGLSADAPETPKGPNATSPAGLFCQVTHADASGLVHVIFWPPMLLHNGLSRGLHWRLHAADDAMHSGSPVGAIVQPGAEIPLPIASEGGEGLALCLATPGDDGEAGPPHVQDWSEPLVFPGVWKEKGSQGSQNVALPKAGQFRGVEVGHGKGRLLLLLLAEPVIQGQPVVRLRVMPQSELHNRTELPVTLELPGAPSITIDGLGHSMLDWQPSGQRPSQLILAQSSCAASQLQGEGDTCLRSSAFDLEDDKQSLVALRSSETGAAQRVRYISASMQVSEHRGVTATGGFRDPCESAHISVSPGLVVSNLTPWALYVLPSSPETGSQSTAIPAGSMQPLLDTWRGADVQQHALLVALTPSIAGSSATHSSTRGEQQRARAQKPAPSFVDSFATFLEEAAGVERKQHAAPNPPPGVHDTDGMQRSLQLFKGAGARTRFRLKDEQGQEALLTCRVLSKSGRLHFVFFVDSQPPVFISNNSHADVEIGISLPIVAEEGNVVYEERQRTWRVAAGTSQHFDSASAPSSAERHSTREASADDAEEEEAFLESVAGQRSSRDLAVGHGPLMRIRRAGSDVWDASFVLLPGTEVSEGWVKATVWQLGATVHVKLEDASSTEQSSTSSISASKDNQTAATGRQPLQLFVKLQCLQISLWDDERRRLLGTGPSVKAESRKQQVATQPSAREAFCFCADALSVLLCRSEHRGAGNDSAVRMNARLAARGIQCDSYLPGSTHPVICCTEAPRREASGTAASSPPLLLDLQVIQASDGCSTQVASLQNSWVRSLSLRLPALALALDDALLAFAERAATLIQPKAASTTVTALTAPSAGGSGSQPDGAGSGGRGTGQSEEQAWREELAVEAQIAAARRLLIEHLDFGPLHFLVDIHVAGTSQRIPYPIDTHRAPVTLSALRGRRLVFRPGVVLQGALAHYTAEALLSAPGVLGSLELLLNPTGLLSSMSAGLADLLGLPLAALMAGSPAQFLASLGRGPASLLWYVSGWTLTSISGFSTAASHVLKRSMVVRPSSRTALGAGNGVAHGIQRLGEEEGAEKSSSLVAGVSRGLLGAVGLPLTGALDLVSGVTAGIASSTGVARQASVRRAQHLAGEGDSSASPALCRRLLSALPQLAEAGGYRLHCRAAEATLLGESGGGVLGALAVNRPLLVLADFALVVLADEGSHVAAVLHLEGATMRLEQHQCQLQMTAPKAHCPGLQDGSSRRHSLQLRLQASIPEGWGVVLSAMMQLQLVGAQ